MTFNEMLAYNQLDWPLLSLLVWLPIAAAAGLHHSNIFKGSRPAVGVMAVLAVVVVELCLSAWALVQFDGNSPDFQFAEHYALWANLSYSLGADGLSILFVPVAALLALLLVLYIGRKPDVASNPSCYTAILLALGFKMGAFLATDVMLFWLFLTAELYPISRLIRNLGKGEKCHIAGRKYFNLMMVSSLLVLAGFLVLANYSPVDGVASFDYATLYATGIDHNVQYVVFPLLFLAFAMKMPLFPFHSWMPRAIDQGPVVIIGVLVLGMSAAAYGFLRFVVLLLPEAAEALYPIIALLCLAGVVYGSLVAMVQKDMHRLLAYGAVAHTAVAIASVFTLSALGVEGAVGFLVSFAIFVSGLFFISDIVTNRVEGCRTENAIFLLFKSTPLLTISFIGFVLGSIGFPGTFKFYAEHAIFLAGFDGDWFVIPILVLQIFLTAAYFLVYFKRTMVETVPGGEGAEPRSFKDLNVREFSIVFVLLFLVFFNGLFGHHLMSATSGSVDALQERFAATEVLASGGPDIRNP